MAALDLMAAAVPLLWAVAVAGVGRPARDRLVHGAALGIAAAVAVVALLHLASGGAAQQLSLPLGLPGLGARLRLDPLSAFFALVAGLGGAASCLFALGHAAHDPAARRTAPFLPAFLGAMLLVLLADDAFTFLLGWESMSVLSWALVVARHEEEANRRAGLVYLVMAGFGLLSLAGAFGLLAGGSIGGFAFERIRGATHPPTIVALALGLALLGTGSKAGLVPLHVWLPLAHPAAPSHVSALMSGVMTKIAVYGFIRIGFDLLAAPWWMGLAVMVLGAVTALVGILHALLETDLKRVLACSTIENIGVVFAGLGLAIAFKANGMEALAALAASAALFHVLNHALFKSLLFLGAGAVLGATGLRGLDRMGGLIHRMPATAFAFLVGSAAIAALPPLNGFASEWLLFQAVLQGAALPQWGLKIAAPAVGAMLALAAALAAACFVRAFGIAFLGRPRSPEAEAAHETDRPGLAAMLALCALCAACGLLPGLVLDLIAPASALLAGARLAPQAGNAWLSVMPAPGAGSYNGLLLAAFVGLSALLAAWAARRLSGGAAARRGPAWGCGFDQPAPLGQYGPASVAQPIRRVLATPWLAARETVEMPPPGALSPARHAVVLRDPAWAFAYGPLARGIDALAGLLNAMQFLTIRRYLGLVFLALVALLLVLAVAA